MKWIVMLIALFCGITAKDWEKCETCLFVMSGYEIFPAIFPELTGKKLEDFTCSRAQKQGGAGKLCREMLRELKGSRTLQRKLKEHYEKESLVYSFCESEMSRKYCP
ncbi:hypothetical protein ANCCAN_08829 [Ancylostoma caninum]|uniref:Saposin B-type domain-containing protein n=1 Tax=Ancylostoma caninum TaxID=29170 RepID=A0A368GL83_ANCCA|nr:hypothetical protein ANCCAN_08829 [Ancylostoma caninum]